MKELLLIEILIYLKAPFYQDFPYCVLLFECCCLDWGAGLLLAVDASSDMIFSINTSTGDVVDSFHVSHSSILRTTGLAFSEEHNVLLVGFWDYSTTGYVYQYTPDGLNKGSVSMCGG